MRNETVKRIAIGGLLASMAMIIMCLGGMIPLATFVCPVLCILLCGTICRICGQRIAWAWYAAVALLSVFLSPDKEAAAVFVILGYYPILKIRIDRMKIRWVIKFLLFNSVILVLYTVMLYVLGIEQIQSEYMELGLIGTLILLVLGNVTFILVDRLLTIFDKKGRKNGR